MRHKRLVVTLLSVPFLWTLYLIYWKNTQTLSQKTALVNSGGSQQLLQIFQNASTYKDVIGHINNAAPDAIRHLNRTARDVIRRKNNTAPKTRVSAKQAYIPHIFVCTLSKSQGSWRTYGDSTPARIFLPSLHKTIQSDYKRFKISVLIGVDIDDAFFIAHSQHMQ